MPAVPRYAPHQMRKTNLEAEGYLFAEWTNQPGDIRAVRVLWRGEFVASSQFVGESHSYSEDAAWEESLEKAEIHLERRTRVYSMDELIADV